MFSNRIPLAKIFAKIDLLVEKLEQKDRQTDRQQGDLKGFFPSLQEGKKATNY